MPIRDRDERSMAAGFAGIENHLFYNRIRGCSLATPRPPSMRWWPRSGPDEMLMETNISILEAQPWLKGMNPQHLQLMAEDVSRRNFAPVR